MRRLVLTVAVAFFLFATLGSGGGQESGWNEMAPAMAPSERHYHDMTYDVESDRIILFGGQRIGPDSDETWAYNFNMNTWTLMQPPISPSPRLMHAMAYDSQSDRVVLFGGIFKAQPETWVYDFNSDTWTNMTPALQPAGHVVSGMAYDSESDRIILFGGDTQNAFIHSSFTDETWSYDYNSNRWTQMNPSRSPSARGGQGMAYDVRSDRTILFGGGSGLLQDLGDTWAYDFNSDTWEEMSPTDAPFPRHEPGMAYDARSDRVVLFGGSAGQDDTWVYDFEDDRWELLEEGIGPPPRRTVGLTYDTESERLILFGGVVPLELDQFYGDTWSYRLQLPRPTPLDSLVIIALGVAVAAGVVVAVLLVWWRRSR